MLEAQGEVARFSKLLPEYKSAPQLTRERLYLQTMEKVMSNTPKVVMEGGSNINVLPLEKLLGNSTASQSKTHEIIMAEPVIKQPVQPKIAVQEQPQPEIRRGRF